MCSIAVLAITLFPAFAATASDQSRPAAAALARPCFACHGDAEPAVIPRLWGRPEETMVARMLEFRDRRRDSVMHRIAKGYREEDYRALARYFFSRNPNRSP